MQINVPLLSQLTSILSNQNIEDRAIFEQNSIVKFNGVVRIVNYRSQKLINDLTKSYFMLLCNDV